MIYINWRLLFQRLFSWFFKASNSEDIPEYSYWGNKGGLKSDGGFEAYQMLCLANEYQRGFDDIASTILEESGALLGELRMQRQRLSQQSQLIDRLFDHLNENAFLKCESKYPAPAA